MINTIFEWILGAISMVLGAIFIKKYEEGQKAVDKINRQETEGKMNEMEQKIYKKYDDTSLDDLVKSSRNKPDSSGGH